MRVSEDGHVRHRDDPSFKSSLSMVTKPLSRVPSLLHNSKAESVRPP